MENAYVRVSLAYIVRSNYSVSDCFINKPRQVQQLNSSDEYGFRVSPDMLISL